MTINSTEKHIIETLWEQEKLNKDDLQTEQEKVIRNEFLKKQAKLLNQILPRISNQITELENMEIFEVDNEIEYLFKKWDIFITDTFAVDAEVLSSFILPYINYNIIYEEPQVNDINFYNAELDLQETSFYEINNEALILHISTYIKKYFDSTELFVPQAKVILTFQNPFKVIN